MVGARNFFFFLSFDRIYSCTANDIPSFRSRNFPRIKFPPSVETVAPKELEGRFSPARRTTGKDGSRFRRGLSFNGAKQCAENKLIRFPISTFGYIERPLMLQPANLVWPVNDVLFKHIRPGPNTKRKTAFRARRTNNQSKYGIEAAAADWLFSLY